MIKLMQIKRAIKSNKKLLRQEYGVKEIGIFGSFARGEPKRKSDIDVLVDFYNVPDLIKFIELERKLQRLLGKKVDLVRKQAIREELKDSILRELKII
jgi:predicted nucleotidyltransferase